MIFILIAAMITFLIASGICYSNDYNGKGAIFLAAGVIVSIVTYQYYESNNKKHANQYSGNTNCDGCSSFDCCQLIDHPIDCHWSGTDCNGDCSGGDCHHG